MMLTMIIQRNQLMLNAVMYTAQNESEAAFLESVFFPNREREKEKERKSFECCFFFFCFVKAMMTNISKLELKPVFLSFCLF